MGRVWCALAWALVGGACVGSYDPGLEPSRDDGVGVAGVSSDEPPPPRGEPFDPVRPELAGARAKVFLTTLALDEDERAALAKDGAAALPGLVDRWLALPQARRRLEVFFATTFQQRQLTIAAFDEAFRATLGGWADGEKERFLRSLEASFARTAVAIALEGRPFTETLTTRTFVLNTPLAVLLAYLDAAPRRDDGDPDENGFWLLREARGVPFRLVHAKRDDDRIPFEESIDPSSPRFMHFSFRESYQDRCRDGATERGPLAVPRVFGALFGDRVGCEAEPSVFSEADWNDWRPVTVRAPRKGERRSVFWDVPALRDARELVLATPRVGFFTTPAFFANWPTNESNDHRVTANQTLIVALGRSFDGRDVTFRVQDAQSRAGEHTRAGSACVACHRTLEPTRELIRQSYTVTHFQRLDLGRDRVPAEATFGFDGAEARRGRGVGDLASALADHPRFAVAWSVRLCQALTANRCLDDDPEIVRIARAFSAANHDFRVLLREVVRSPVTTHAAPTATTDSEGVVVAVADRDALCARLETRLGVGDVCDLAGASQLGGEARDRARHLAMALPGFGYARGDDALLPPHDAGLFFAAGTVKLCEALAEAAVDGSTDARFRATSDAAADVNPVLAKMVHELIGVPSGDERAGAVRDVLARHRAAARVAGASTVLALRSTFVVACAAAPSVSFGL